MIQGELQVDQKNGDKWGNGVNCLFKLKKGKISTPYREKLRTLVCIADSKAEYGHDQDIKRAVRRSGNRKKGDKDKP